jgi:hypothetical protein
MASSEESAKEKATCNAAKVQQATRIIQIDKKGKASPPQKKIADDIAPFTGRGKNKRVKCHIDLLASAGNLRPSARQRHETSWLEARTSF